MFNRIKLLFKKIFHVHFYKLRRWHITHGPNAMDPPEIEAEYVCIHCGKKTYQHFSNVEKYSKIFGSIIPMYEIYEEEE